MRFRIILFLNLFLFTANNSLAVLTPDEKQHQKPKVMQTFPWGALDKNIQYMVFDRCTAGAKLGLYVSGKSTHETFSQLPVMMLLLDHTNSMFKQVRDHVFFDKFDVTFKDCRVFHNFSFIHNIVDLDNHRKKERLFRVWFQTVVLDLSPDLSTATTQGYLRSLNAYIEKAVGKNYELKRGNIPAFKQVWDEALTVNPSRLFELSFILFQYPLFVSELCSKAGDEQHKISEVKVDWLYSDETIS